MSQIIETLNKAKAEFEKTVADNLDKLKAERKELERQIKEIDSMIADFTGKSAGGSAGSTNRVRVEPEQILNFLGKDEKTVNEVAEHFGCSYQSATVKIKALKSAKKVMVNRVDGNKIYYKVK